MSLGSAHITTTPTKVDSTNIQQIGVEQNASPSSLRFREGHTYTYNFGFRKPGDTLIDFRRDHETYASPQDVKLLVRCRTEPGQYITHAIIEVKQCSEKRDARIIDGGIGQDHITIEIDAGSTYWLNYEVHIFAIRSQ